MTVRHLRIAGRVQGVGFRDWMRREAEPFGLAGWVRNAGEDVEALIAGESEAVERLIRACRRGPPAATVTSVVERAAEAPGHVGFLVLPSI